MDPEEAIFEVEDAMTKCVDYLIHEFAGVRTGKASPALIENLDVHVQAYGAVSKLKSLAVINSPEPRMLVVQPFDPNRAREPVHSSSHSHVPGWHSRKRISSLDCTILAGDAAELGSNLRLTSNSSLEDSLTVFSNHRSYSRA